MYKLYVSYSCGISYEISHESDKIEELIEIGKRYDEDMLRWIIKDEKEKLVELSKIHKHITDTMALINQKRKEE